MKATKEPKTRKPPTPRAARLALHVLIRFYTHHRDWFMVERLYNDLGKVEAHLQAVKEEKERNNATQPK